jgi:glutathione S-transferase
VITVYQFASSPFSEKIRRALAYKAVPYEVHEVDRAAIPGGRYLDLSPTGKFPVLDHDGHVVADSTDIVRYLDAQYPEKPLLPTAPREAAFAHVIEDWADESLYFYEMTARLAWEHNLEPALEGFAAGMPDVPREMLRAGILKGVGELTKAQGVGRKTQPQVTLEIERHYHALDDLLDGQDWLAGPALSVADLAVFAQHRALQGAVEGREIFARTGNVAAWAERVDTAAPDQQ